MSTRQQPVLDAILSVAALLWKFYCITNDTFIYYITKSCLKYLIGLCHNNNTFLLAKYNQ